MTEPIVTIVTPSLNQGRFIGETIESVLRQTYGAIDYVVLDGGSDDETHDVLRSFGSRVRWEVAKDSGQSDAINRGWRAGRGSILAWLCADDLLEPHAVQAGVDALTANPHAAVAYGRGAMFTDEHTDPQDVTPPFHLWRLINLFDFIFQPAAFFRRSAVEEVGWIDERLHYTMDWDLLIRLGLRYPFVPIDSLLAKARWHPESKTASGGRKRFRELKKVIRRYSDERRPPSYWLYLLETYRKLAEDTLKRFGGRSERVMLGGTFRIDRVYGAVAHRTILKLDDWWPDRFAGSSVNYLVSPLSGGAIRLAGDIPADLAPQTLKVSVEGAERWSGALDAGPFSIVVPTAPGEDTTTATRVRVDAERWNSVFHSWGYNAMRKIAYRLDAIERV